MPTLSDLEKEFKKKPVRKKKSEMVPGEPKNLGGRPPGAKNKTTILKEVINNNVMAQFAEFAGQAAKSLIEGVKEKDPTCTKIFWDRVMPSQKSVDGAVGSAPVINITVSGMDNIPQAIIIENESDDK